MAKSIADIEAVVIKYFPLEKSLPEDLKTDSKKRDVVRVRQITTYLCRKEGIIFKEIAKHFKQGTSGAMMAYYRINDELSVDAKYRGMIENILTEIQ